MEGHISLYIHIPFCVKKCRYCDFPSFAGDSAQTERYFEALKEEIREEAVTAGRTADTVYFGGGTPSCVDPRYICEVMEEIGRKYRIPEDAEISMEMNPGTLKEESISIYRDAGINRISLGCQSLNASTLKYLGRIHSAEDVRKTADILKENGYYNINFDLISSVPGETAGDLERSIRGIIGLQPSHISVYSLILEPGTPLYSEYEKGMMKDLPDEERVAENDRLTLDILREAGYQRYEISNFSRPGMECRHNLTYWRRGDYRGFGLAAASLDGKRRFTNTKDLSVYIKSPGKTFSEDRILSEEEEMEEFMFLGLRECRGVSASDFKEYFGRDMGEVFGTQIENQIKQGFMESENGRFFYNDRGLDVSNILMAQFCF